MSDPVPMHAVPPAAADESPRILPDSPIYFFLSRYAIAMVVMVRRGTDRR